MGKKKHSSESNVVLPPKVNNLPLNTVDELPPNKTSDRRTTLRDGLLIAAVTGIFAVIVAFVTVWGTSIFPQNTSEQATPDRLDVNINISTNEKSASEIMALADLYYDANEMDKVLDCYASEKVLQDPATYPFVQANLGYFYDTGTFVIEDREKALEYYNNAIEHGLFAVIPAVLKNIAYTDEPDYAEINRLLKLSYDNGIQSVAMWIGSIMEGTSDKVIAKECLRRFCFELTEQE